jgi:cytochrome bd-type quinol oxidase subunit 1
MLAAIICREFGWTWQEYEKQPSWFIDIILKMMQAENEAMKRK